MAGHQHLIASIPLFSRLPPESINEIDTVAIERHYEPGAEVVTEGEGGVAFFVVVDGTAEVAHGQGEAASSPLRPGAYFGEMALVDGHQRSATVRATTPLTCLVLTRWDFLAILRSNADLAVELLEAMSARVRTLEATIASMTGER